MTPAPTPEPGVGLATVHLHVLRNATFEALAEHARCAGATLRLAPRTTFSSYDPWLDLLSPDGPSFAGQSALVLLALDALPEAWDGDRLDDAKALARVAALVEAALARGARDVLVATFAAPIDAGPGFCDAAALYRLNGEIARLAEEDARVELIDVARLIGRLGEERALDARFWAHFRAPFSQELHAAIAAEVCRAVARRAGDVRKVVVLDADNTLWGGVVGEDGPSGIALSENDPKGRPFHAFQRQLRALRGRGVLLALASKNEPADVAAALAHPESALRAEHFAASRVGWGDKAESLVQIAAELGVGLDSLVFVDDSAIECARVRAALPMVAVWQVPAQAHRLPREFARVPWFGARPPTEDDARRAADYAAERRRATEAAAFGDREAFLRSLEMVVRVWDPGAHDLARLAQLCQKTNQFNLTTTRHSAADLARALASDDALLVGVSSADRFGDQGTVGLALIERGTDACEIRTLLLSCRALGRSIEQALLAEAVRRARARWGARPVRGRHLPTAKNGQTRDFYGRAGFAPERDSPAERTFLLPADRDPPCPDLFKLERAPARSQSETRWS